MRRMPCSRLGRGLWCREKRWEIRRALGNTRVVPGNPGEFRERSVGSHRDDWGGPTARAQVHGRVSLAVPPPARTAEAITGHASRKETAETSRCGGLKKTRHVTSPVECFFLFFMAGGGASAAAEVCPGGVVEMTGFPMRRGAALPQGEWRCEPGRGARGGERRDGERWMR